MDTLSRSRPRRVGRSAPLKWRVSDRLWGRLAPLLADPPRRFRYPGRVRYSPRLCLEGILYVLYTDTPWLEVPLRELGLPSGETCRRRLEEWSRRGLVAGRDRDLVCGVGRGGAARLVARACGRFAGGGEKGGAKVARTLTGKQGSRFHLAVDGVRAALAVRLSAGNENERRHLLPLLDALAGRGIKPAELWADRGYHSGALERELRAARDPAADQPAPPPRPADHTRHTRTRGLTLEA